MHKHVRSGTGISDHGVPGGELEGHDADHDHGPRRGRRPSARATRRRRATDTRAGTVTAAARPMATTTAIYPTSPADDEHAGAGRPRTVRTWASTACSACRTVSSRSGRSRGARSAVARRSSGRLEHDHVARQRRDQQDARPHDRHQVSPRQRLAASHRPLHVPPPQVAEHGERPRWCRWRAAPCDYR